MADVQVAAWLAPLLELARDGDREAGLPPRIGEVLPLRRGREGLLAAARELRARRYRRGVLLTPSLSAALVFFLGRVRERRGTDTDARGILLTDRVPAERFQGVHRSALYLTLTGGRAASDAPAPRLHLPERARRKWAESFGAGGPTVGICPSSHAPSRQWEVERFAEVARRLARRGARVLVFGAPAERERTARVAGDWAVDLGGRTDLPTLAAGLAACDLVIANDSGPLHLAAACGTATVSLWGAGDPAQTGVPAPGHRMLRHPELPCVPCVRNECPRRGPGYLLPEAERECLRLITVDEVDEAAEHVAREYQ